METRNVPDDPGHYYGACQLGDARGRLAWVQQIGADRIRAIQQLRTVVMPIAQSFVDEMAVLKSRQLEAARAGGDLESVRAEMQRQGVKYLRQLESSLSEDERLLESAQMPRDGVMQLARQWVDEFVSETWTNARGDPQVPDDLLAGLPESVRVFYAPR
jgi:hypothetical protein